MATIVYIRFVWSKLHNLLPMQLPNEFLTFILTYTKYIPFYRLPLPINNSSTHYLFLCHPHGTLKLTIEVANSIEKFAAKHMSLPTYVTN